MNCSEIVAYSVRVHLIKPKEIMSLIALQLSSSYDHHKTLPPWKSLPSTEFCDDFASIGN